MPEALTPDAYDALVTAAKTYRAGIVVRLAGEAGLRTAEITRVTPGDLHESDAGTDPVILGVPTGDGDTPGDEDTRAGNKRGQRGTGDRETDERETIVPASLAAELRRYAETEGLDDGDPFVDVSARRVQMIVSETAERAAARTDGRAPPDATPRDLRATFARRLLVDRGVSPHVVREAGGWETMGSLDDYLDPLDGAALVEAVADDGEGVTADPIAGQASAVLNGFEALADAGTAGGAETNPPIATVPDRLVDADRWSEAWVVRGWTDGERAEVVGAAGVGREVLVDRGVADGGPWRDALAEGEPVASDGHPVTGGRPSLAVPVRYHGATHGALCVVAANGASVTDYERRALSTLGACLGWAVTAGRWHDLLHSDAVTEVEFRTADDGAFIARASASLGCRIELGSTVSVDDGASRFYLTVEDARAQEIADVIEDVDGVDDLRVIETRDNGCSVSVRVAGGSAVRALTEHGATVRDATGDGGDVRVVADLPEGADVRPVANGLRKRFPDARLASKESVARSPITESSLREGVTDRFTDRQWAALSAAYHGGYFDWPRGSTAEEVADAMDVSSPTFHNHLRKAERALLDGLFEEERRRSPSGR